MIETLVNVNAGVNQLKTGSSNIASPSWSGYLNVECVSTIQKLFTKSVKWGVTSKSYQVVDIFDVRDEKLFSAMCYVYV